MGEAKRRNHDIGVCIYCGSSQNLSNEHVLPYGLGGDLILKKASCNSCAKETGRLEQRLLRGHWWPHRLCLGLPSRRANEEVPDLKVKITKADGSEYQALLSMKEQTMAVEYRLDPALIFQGKIREDDPNGRVGIRQLGTLPNKVKVGLIERLLAPDERITIPINIDATDVCRFLAKVAHGYAIHRSGLDACEEYFLPRIILGDSKGALSYIGCIDSKLLLHPLPEQGLHALMALTKGGFLVVYIQLFRTKANDQAIYEIVVGRKKINT